MNEVAKEADRWLFINDWSFRSFVRLTVLLMVLLSIYTIARWFFPSSPIEYLGYLFVPLILFVPGAGVLRVFRLHGNGLVRSALYSLAISLLILMFVGFFLNLLHYGGVMESPLDYWPLNISFIAVMALILYMAIKRDGEYQAPPAASFLDPRVFLAIALAILPPFAVLMGTNLTDFNGDRTMLQAIVTALCLMPLAAISQRIKHYDLLILSASVSLLFQRVLMTNYLMGYDVFTEYTAARITIANGWWNVAAYTGMEGAGANTALSVVTLAPMLHHLTGIGLIDLLRIVYPFIFAFLALAVYKAVQSQLGTGPALVGVFLLIGYQAFYNLLSQMAKQEIAEIFLVILLVVLTESVYSRRSQRMMAALCVLGVVVSHYGMAYITMGFVGGMFALGILSIFQDRRSGENPLKKISRSLRAWWERQRSSEVMSIYLLLFYVGIFFAWFSLTASGVMLGFIKYSGEYIPAPSVSTGLSLSQFDALEFLLIDYGSPLHNVEKYLVLTAQILSVVGLVHVVLNRKTLYKSVGNAFINMAILATLLLLACYVVPRISSLLYFARFFHLTFIFIGGFMLLGVFAIVRAIGKLVTDKINFNKGSKAILAACVGFLVIFTLFNTSAIFSLTNDYSNSFTLDETNSWAIYSDTDVVGAKWVGMEEHRGNRVINGDQHRFTIFIGDSVPSAKLKYQWTQSSTDSLIYLSTWNNEYDYVYPINTVGAEQTYTPLSEVLDQFNGNYNMVYNGGGSTTVIYVPPSDPTTNPPGPTLFEYEEAPIYYLGGVAATLSLLGLAVLFVNRRRS